MYPPQFEYYRANSVNEALSLLNQHQGAKVLAGGHSLIPAMNLRLADPGVLIDIGRIEGLKGINSDSNGHRIGALTTHAMVAAASGLPDGLAEAAGMVGDPQVRNRGTVGGNVSHADPASDLPTALLALGATFHVIGSNGERSVPARAFFIDLFQTALADGEILIAITVPAEGVNTGSAYMKLFNPASRYAIVGAAAQVTLTNGAFTAASVAVGGLTPKATKAMSVETALMGKTLDANTITAAAEAVQNDLGDDILGDIHASADYRRQMATVFVRRAVTKAAERAGA
jgi:carbon-monoxide dehydrogenase medium subunit